MNNLQRNIFNLHNNFEDLLNIRSELAGVEINFERAYLEDGYLSIHQLEALCDGLDLSIDRFINSELDLLEFSRKSNLGPKYLPEKYEIENGSYASAKTILTIMRYLTDFHGQQMTSIFLKLLGVGYENFVNEDIRVHPQMVMDALSIIETMGIDSRTLKLIARRAPLISADSEYGKRLRNSRSTIESFQYAFSEVIPNCYDNLFTYKINRLYNGLIEITTHPTGNAYNTETGEVIGSRDLCLYKQGIFQSKLRYTGNFKSHIKEHKCIYHGDDHCHYELQWEPQEAALLH
jgi:predicted hydrocarbon binding protein